MNEGEIESLADKIVDVIHAYQSELSDGFQYYEDLDTWDNIKKELINILST